VWSPPPVGSRWTYVGHEPGWHDPGGEPSWRGHSGKVVRHERPFADENRLIARLVWDKPPPKAPAHAFITRQNSAEWREDNAAQPSRDDRQIYKAAK